MLYALSISNFAIIEQSEMEFSSGMTAITGESGVGKSIMLDALKFAMGSRASQECILKGNKRADIRASFDISHLPLAMEWLKDRDLDHNTDCILRRVMTPDGRSRGYINGASSTLSDLRSISELLLHLHGQHGYHSLLQPLVQRELLDNYANNNNQLRKVKQLWQACAQCKTKIDQFDKTDQVKSAKIQLLEYQVHELDKLNLQQGELASLESDQSLLAESCDIGKHCQILQSLLSTDEQNIADQLISCQKLVANNKRLSNVGSLLQEASIQIEEALSETVNIERHIETDPEKLSEIEHRLSLIHDIARKHRVQPSELQALHTSLAKELDTLNAEREDISLLKQRMQQLEKSFMDEAIKLSNRRKQSAKKLAKAINNLLQELGMATSLFHVSFSELKTPDSYGIDKVCFQIQGDEKIKAQPLDKIASGGELSRISLAIQIVTAQSTGIKTLVFDEIDVGIGGATAEIVGRLLRQLGGQGQVLCITHQAQVASQAHSHLSVMKKGKAHQQVNMVKPLNDLSREKEVARMIAGVEITGQALAHARDMINRARA